MEKKKDEENEETEIEMEKILKLKKEIQIQKDKCEKLQKDRDEWKERSYLVRKTRKVYNWKSMRYEDEDYWEPAKVLLHIENGKSWIDKQC